MSHITSNIGGQLTDTPKIGCKDKVSDEAIALFNALFGAIQLDHSLVKLSDGQTNKNEPQFQSVADESTIDDTLKGLQFKGEGNVNLAKVFAKLQQLQASLERKSVPKIDEANKSSINLEFSYPTKKSGDNLFKVNNLDQKASVELQNAKTSVSLSKGLPSSSMLNQEETIIKETKISNINTFEISPKDKIGEKSQAELIAASTLKKDKLAMMGDSSLKIETQTKDLPIKKFLKELTVVGSEKINYKSEGASNPVSVLTSSTSSNNSQNSNSNGFNSNNAASTLEQLNMFEKNWGKNLVSRLERALQTGKETIEMTLSPKRLGKLKVNLSLSNNIAKISILTETPGAALLLSEAETKLAQMLESSGVKLANLQTGTEQNNSHGNNNKQGNSESLSSAQDNDDSAKKEEDNGTNSRLEKDQLINVTA